jgi:hypothetical protein
MNESLILSLDARVPLNALVECDDVATVAADRLDCYRVAIARLITR